MKKLLLIGLLGLYSTLANAEIVTNSAGEKIELKPNGTWIKAASDNSKSIDSHKITKDDLIFSDKIITGNPNPLSKKLKNGEDHDTDVKIDFMVGIPENIKSFDLEKQNKMIFLAIENTKSTLKNPYSFVPRKIQILDSSATLWYVVVEYTAKNSYGADVANKRIFKFSQDGKIIGAV